MTSEVAYQLPLDPYSVLGMWRTLTETPFWVFILNDPSPPATNTNRPRLVQILLLTSPLLEVPSPPTRTMKADAEWHKMGMSARPRPDPSWQQL